MPLEILLIMVIGGITGIVVLLHWLGLSERAELDRDAATRAWLREFPEDVPVRVTPCENRRAALISTANGPGIVWAVGADTTARYLSGARMRVTRSGLRIELPDFSAPVVKLKMDARVAVKWPEILEKTV